MGETGEFKGQLRRQRYCYCCCKRHEDRMTHPLSIPVLGTVNPERCFIAASTKYSLANDLFQPWHNGHILFSGNVCHVSVASLSTVHSHVECTLIAECTVHNSQRSV